METAMVETNSNCRAHYIFRLPSSSDQNLLKVKSVYRWVTVKKIVGVIVSALWVGASISIYSTTDFTWIFSLIWALITFFMFLHSALGKTEICIEAGCLQIEEPMNSITIKTSDIKDLDHFRQAQFIDESRSGFKLFILTGITINLKNGESLKFGKFLPAKSRNKIYTELATLVS